MLRVKKILIRALIALVVYLIYCRFFLPPITITQIVSVFEGHGFKRTNTNWQVIPYNIGLAIIASEDQLFAEHYGFDTNAIKQSLEGKRGKKGKKGSAASTISQQTVKNVFLWQGSGWGRYIRKIPETILTPLADWFWGKKRMLVIYGNVAETGKGIFGFEAAAQHYFSKPAKDLTRAEAAMIVAALPNPKKFTVMPISKRISWRYPQIVLQMRLIESHPDIQKLLK